MRLVIQRVKSARVSSGGRAVGEIGRGLFVLLGVGEGDKEEYADFLAEKLVNLRILSDSSGKMNLSVKGVSGEVLVVSQFTLYADTSYGRRPSFVKAAKPDLALKVYERFIQKVKEHGLAVSTGKFGAVMEIESVTDGPVTILLEHSS